MRHLGASYRIALIPNSLFEDVVEDGLELGEAAAGHVRDSAEGVAVAVDSQASSALGGRSRQGDKIVETHCG